MSLLAEDTAAADLGVEVEDVALAMRLMVGGDDRVSRFVDPSVNEDYDVQLRLTESDRSDPRSLMNLYLHQVEPSPHDEAQAERIAAAEPKSVEAGTLPWDQVPSYGSLSGDTVFIAV